MEEHKLSLLQSYAAEGTELHGPQSQPNLAAHRFMCYGRGKLDSVEFTALCPLHLVEALLGVFREPASFDADKL